MLAANQRALGARVALAMVGAGFCAVTMFCIVTIPIGIGLLGLAVAYGVAPTKRPDLETALGAGALSALGLLPFLGSLAIGAQYLASFPHIGAPLALALGLQAACAVLGTAAMSPLLAAAAFRASTSSSIGDALARSVLVASRRPVATALVGAMHGALLSVPVLAFQLLPPPANLLAALAGCALAWCFYGGLSAALAVPSDGSLRSLASLGVPTWLALAGMLVAVLAIEPRMSHPFTPRAGSDIGSRPSVYSSLGVGLRWSDGATTFLRAPFQSSLSQRPIEWHDPDTGHDVICIEVDTGACLGAELDANHIRVDDVPLERLAARGGVGAAFVIVVGLSLALLAARRARAAAATLGACEVESDVVLRLGPGGAVAVADGALVASGGEVHLESGERTAMILLDRPVPIVLEGDPPADGTRWRLVGRAHPAGLGPREGRAPVAPDAWLAPTRTSPDVARALHAARASATLAAFALLLTLFGASIPLLLL